VAPHWPAKPLIERRQRTVKEELEPLYAAWAAAQERLASL
jgi:hypothetical protein